MRKVEIQEVGIPVVRLPIVGWPSEKASKPFPPVPGEGPYLLLEDGSRVLLEDGSGVLLEIGGGSMKPYDYEVEYLEMNEDSGLAYLNFGNIINKNVYDVYAKFTLLGYNDDVDGNNMWFGIHAGTNAYNISVKRHNFDDNSAWSFITSNLAGFAAIFPVEIGSTYEIELYKNGVTIVNGIKYQALIQPNVVSNGNFYVFYRDDHKSFTYGRVWYIQIFKDDEILYDFIPVSKDGIGYMYDRVTGQLFGAQGGGTFAVGPRI